MILYKAYVQKSNIFHIGQDILHHLYKHYEKGLLNRG